MRSEEMIEVEHEQPYEVTLFGTMGFGNPNAGISLEKHASEELFEQMRDKAAEIITSGAAMVAVTETDDGCFDGRPTGGLVERDSEGTRGIRVIDAEHERPMVAGGGYATGTTIRIALGEHGESIDEAIQATGRTLYEKGIVCGAHTGPVHGEGTCGCGAIDLMDKNMANAVSTYSEGIKTATQAIVEGVVGVQFDEASYEKAMKNWREALEDETYFATSTGASRSEAILATQDAINEANPNGTLEAVTKDLEGKHNEWFLTINTVEGKTFSQAKFRALMAEHFPTTDPADLPQVFPLDAYRLGELTKASVKDDEAFMTGLEASIAYQLGTAAELTDGTLPIYIIKK